MWPRRFLAIDRRARATLILAIGGGATAAATLAVWTLVLARVIAAVVIDGRSLADEWPSIALLVALLLIRAAALAISGPIAERAAERYRLRTRERLLVRALEGGPDASSATERATLIGAGVDALDEYTSRFLPALALAGIVPIGVLAMIAALDPWSSTVLLLAGPLLVALLAVIGRRTRQLADARFEELAWLGSLYADMLRGIATLKAYGREQDTLDVIDETSTQFGHSTMKVLRTAFQTSLVIEWAATAATALVAVEVSLRLVEHGLGFATALSVLMLTPEFFAPLRTLAAEYHAGQSGAAALAAIDAYLDTPSVEDPPEADPGSHRSASIPPGVEFIDLDLGHDDPARFHLSGVSFVIEPGETVALVGPSAIGKSSLVDLLLGFEQPLHGAVLLDGEPPDRCDLAEWRRRVAWVPQNPTLLHGSIEDNVRLGRPEATRSEVLTALDVARARSFVDAMPAGLDTVIGERGARLSGGERRRLALARALLLDAPMMILDEFTAHLDPVTEQALLESIAPFLESRTVLLITHRPAVLGLADRIVDLAPASDPSTRTGAR